MKGHTANPNDRTTVPVMWGWGAPRGELFSMNNEKLYDFAWDPTVSEYNASDSNKWRKENVRCTCSRPTSTQRRKSGAAKPANCWTIALRNASPAHCHDPTLVMPHWACPPRNKAANHIQTVFFMGQPKFKKKKIKLSNLLLLLKTANPQNSETKIEWHNQRCRDEFTFP